MVVKKRLMDTNGKVFKIKNKLTIVGCAGR